MGEGGSWMGCRVVEEGVDGLPTLGAHNARPRNGAPLRFLKPFILAAASVVGVLFVARAVSESPLHWTALPFVAHDDSGVRSSILSP